MKEDCVRFFLFIRKDFMGWVKIFGRGIRDRSFRSMLLTGCVGFKVRQCEDGFHVGGY